MPHKEVCQDFEKNYSYLAGENWDGKVAGRDVNLPEIVQNKP